MRLKTDLKRIKKLSNELGTIFDSANRKVCGTKLCEGLGGDHEGRGCCCNCNVGYYENHWTKDRKSIKKRYIKLKKQYGTKFGFFDIKNKRCGLPRYLRSYLCLSCKCEVLHKELGRTKVKKSDELVKKIVDLREKLNMLN